VVQSSGAVMKRIFASLLVVLVAACLEAQAPPAPGSTAAAGSPTALIPPGSAIVTELAKSLDARKLKPGDKIEARVSMDFLAHGKNVLPRSTKIFGHVVEAKVKSKENDSTITIAFDHVSLKNGPDLPLAATIQAIGAPVLDFNLNNPPYSDASSGAPGMPGAGRTNMGYPPLPHGPAEPGDSEGGVPARTAAPLGPTSQGVAGLKGISISSTGENSEISSKIENVHLNSGTQLVLHVAGPQN